MAGRKWVVRGLVFSVLAAIAVGGVAYQHWTDPAEVRRQVLEQFSAKFPGANVTVESARLRLLGGIAISELRMTRRDDADLVNFLYVPSAVIYLDKEHLLGGKLAIRKLELDRPRLRVLRDGDGHWNLAGILAPPDLRERIPMLVIKQGTIIIEDRRTQGAAPLEIKDVNLKIVNDPDMTVTFEGTGNSEATGPVQWHGSWQRDSGQTTLTCAAPAIPIGPALVQRLAGACPEIDKYAHDFSGNGELHATLSYYPDRKQAWEHDVTFHLTAGKLRHKLLPEPLEDISASLRCVNGHIGQIEAHARAGSAALTLTLDEVSLPLPCCTTADELFKKLHLTIDNLPVDSKLLHALPEKHRKIEQEFSPNGPINVDFTMWFEKQSLRNRLTLKPQQMTGSFINFPYLVTRLTGEIICNWGEDIDATIEVNLTGSAKQQPIHITSKVKGTKPDWNFSVDVWGNNVPIDDDLLQALRANKENPKPYTLAASFHATGLVDFRVHCDWHRDPSEREGGHFDNRYILTFRNGSVKYDVFPLLLNKVEGILDIEPDHWTFHHFKANHGDCTFYTGGRSWHDPVTKEEHIEIGIAGRGVLLDEDLREALVNNNNKNRDLKRTWDTFSPSGQIDFDGTIRMVPARGPDAPPDISLTVWPQKCQMTPAFFRYTLADLTGKVRYENGVVELEDIRAAHNGTNIRLDRAVVQLKKDGGFVADLVNLHADPLVTDSDFLKALQDNPGLQKAVGALAVEGSLRVDTRLYIDAPPENDKKPRIYWDGAAVMEDATLHTGIKIEHVKGTVALRGWHNGQRIDGAAGNLAIREMTIFDQPIRNIRGEMLISEDEPEVLKFPGLMANYFGGQIYGPLRLEFGSRLRYRLDLTASQVDLNQFGLHNFKNSELNGQAVAQIYLEGEGAETSGLKGNGRIDVPNGRMYNLPLLLDLLKFLGLRLPDRTAFEEAHVVFDIEGLRAHVKQLELYGNAISLRGSGDTNIDGRDLNFIFYLDWARLGQMLPAGVRDIPREISNQLFRIEMRGEVGNLHFRKEPVPLIVDPFRKIFAGEEEKR